MRIILFCTLILLTSCGIIQSYTGEQIVYDADIYNKYDQKTQISRFNSTELDSLFLSTTEIGVAKYEWTMDNKGNVMNVKLLKSTFSDSLQNVFFRAIETAEQIPFENEGVFLREITIKIKSEDKRHMTWTYPKRRK